MYIIIVCGAIKLDGQEEIWSLNEESELTRYDGYSKAIVEVKNNVRAQESAVKIIGSTLTMEENAYILNNNNAISSGGGLYLDNADFTMKRNAQISGNEANDGGEFFQYASQTTMQGESVIQGNKATGMGGL